MASFIRIGLSVTSVLLAVLVVAFAWTLWTTQAHYSVIFLALSLIICSLTVLQKKGDAKGIKVIALRVGPFLLICLSIVASLYFYKEYEDLLYRAGAYTATDLIFSVVIFLPLMALIWKEGGAILTLLVLLFLGYSAYGNILPGSSLSQGPVVRQNPGNARPQLRGDIWICYPGGRHLGSHIRSLCRPSSRVWCLRCYHEALHPVRSETEVGLAPDTCGHQPYFRHVLGCRSRQCCRNRILYHPASEEVRFPPHFAGAIEATASTGGQIMPPIMGATAFLMAALLGESYAKIMLIGFIPALIYYCSVAFSVHLLSKKYLVGLSKEDDLDGVAPLTRRDLFKLLPMAVSLCVLLLAATYFLIPLMKAALYGIICLLGVELVYLLVTSRSTLIRDFLKGILKGSQAGRPACRIHWSRGGGNGHHR